MQNDFAICFAVFSYTYTKSYDYESVPISHITPQNHDYQPNYTLSLGMEFLMKRNRLC